MIIKISDKIYIKNPDAEMVRAIKKSLTIPNPVYEVMRRKRNMRALYAVKKNFTYYSERDNELIVGRGCEIRLKRFPRQMMVEYDVVDTKLSKPFRTDNLILREYQVVVPEEIIKHKNGIVKLGTGFGKTLMALKVIELLQLTALIIVPRTSILNQFKQELKKYYDYEAGIIQGQTWNIKDITISSVATLKQRELKDITKKFGLVIVDEAHTSISDKGIKVIQSFSPKFLFGLTATPDRSDGQGEAIKFTFGDIIIDRELPQTKPSVEIIKSNVNIEVEEYADMINHQTLNSKRNLLIIKKVIDELKAGRKILILTKRVSHYEYFYQLLKDHYKVFKITSNAKEKKNQEKILKGLRENNLAFDVILGTYSMLSTGVDISRLDTLVLAGDLKSSVLTKQSTGRILRLFEGKEDPKVIDIDDNLNGILHRQALARKRFYKDNEWTII